MSFWSWASGKDFIDTLTGKSRKKSAGRTAGEELRRKQAMEWYNPSADRPLNAYTDQGSFKFDKQKGGLAYNGRLSSPLIQANNQTQLSLAKQANRLASDTGSLFTNPAKSSYYQAYKGSIDDSFDQVRGQLAERYSTAQSNALGRILGNKAMYGVAQLRGQQPYEFYNKMVMPLLGNYATTQQGFQGVNDSVQTGILNTFNAGQAAQDNSTQRRSAWAANQLAQVQASQQARIGRADSRRSGALGLAGGLIGGVGGFFLGGPAGAAAGASLGSSLGKSFAPQPGGQVADLGNAFSNAAYTYNYGGLNKGGFLNRPAATAPSSSTLGNLTFDYSALLNGTKGAW